MHDLGIWLLGIFLTALGILAVILGVVFIGSFF